MGKHHSNYCIPFYPTTFVVQQMGYSLSWRLLTNNSQTFKGHSSTYSLFFEDSIFFKRPVVWYEISAPCLCVTLYPICSTNTVIQQMDYSLRLSKHSFFIDTIFLPIVLGKLLHTKLFCSFCRD